MNTQFKNKFGEVSFRPISELMHVRDIRGACLDDDCMFDIETAEKVALITENRRVQLCPFKGPKGWRCYVILHESASTGMVAEIESLSYAGGTPAREIQAARRSEVHQ